MRWGQTNNLEINLDCRTTWDEAGSIRYQLIIQEKDHETTQERRKELGKMLQCDDPGDKEVICNASIVVKLLREITTNIVRE